MQTKLKHPNLTIFALLLSSFMTSADTMVLQPIIDLLATDVFPEYGYSMSAMIMNISAIALAVISVASGALVRFGKKRLIILGTIFFTVGGVAGSFITNIYYIWFTRLFEGFGAGLVMTVSLMMIPQIFTDQARVDKIMGYNGILMALFSGIITFTSGYLALVSWKLPFMYYLVGVVILVFQVLYIPDDRKELAAEGGAPAKSHISKAGVMHAVSGLAFGLFTSFFFVCISGVLAENGVGDASMAGMASTFNTIGSFISGFFFAYLFGKLKDYSFTVFYLFMIVAWAGLLNTSNAIMVYFAAFVNGIGWNLFFSGYLAKVSMISDESSVEANMALANGVFYIGQFLTPFAMTAITAISGNTSPVFAMKVVWVILVILAVLHLISAITSSKKQKA